MAWKCAIRGPVAVPWCSTAARARVDRLGMGAPKRRRWSFASKMLRLSKDNLGVLGEPAGLDECTSVESMGVTCVVVAQQG